MKCGTYSHGDPMFGLRHSTHPTDLIIAEMLAFPFASVEALENRCSGLPLSLYGGNGPTASGRLWRAAERYILSQCNGTSLEEVTAIRDFTWFSPKGIQEVHLSKILERFVSDRIDIRGSYVSPKSPVAAFRDGRSLVDDRASARLAWQWAVLSMPPEYLLATHPHLSQQEFSVSLTMELPSHLDTLLRDCGYAESHAHVGAVAKFTQSWAVLMGRAHDLLEDDFLSPAANFNEGQDFTHWILAAALGRYVLAEGLMFQSQRQPSIRQAVQAILKDLEASKRDIIEDGLNHAIRLLLAGRLPHEMQTRNTSRRQIVLAEMKAAAAELFRQTFDGLSPTDELEERDPLLKLIQQKSTQDKIDVLPDGELMRRMTLLEKRLPVDGENESPALAQFRLLFWQYVRVRCLFYRHVTQRPQIPGLQWFIRFFDRLRPTKTNLDYQTSFRNALSVSGWEKGLKSLELRTAPPKTFSEIRVLQQHLQEFLRKLNLRSSASRGEDADLHFGTVLHFIKNRGIKGGYPNPYWRKTHSHPSQRRFRYQHYLEEAVRIDSYHQRPGESQAKRNIGFDVTGDFCPLYAYIYHNPEILELICGLDICTDELGVPNWAIASQFRAIRELADHSLKRVGINGTMRATAHAGEDFVHLMTGLRNVDEAVDLLALRPGDRIGHGISVGIEPFSWSQATGRVPMSLEDRMLDLLWAQDKCLKDASGQLGRFAKRISHQIDAILKELKCRDREEALHLRSTLLEPSELLDRHLRHWADDPTSRYIDDPSNSLSERFLRDPNFFQQARKLMWVDTSQEGDLLYLLQNLVRKRLAAIGIAVEVNPSSNLLIGNLSDLERHPLWRLRPIYPKPDDPPRLSICIGSDDPITFATTIREEYLKLYDVMISNGIGNDTATAWLDDVRECGLTYRFTRPYRRN